MADPDYALVEILCSPSQFGDVAAIPNLIVLASPLYGDTPNVIAVNALADTVAQQAAQQRGATVNVLQSAEDYAAKLSVVFDAINDGDGDGIA